MYKRVTDMNGDYLVVWVPTSGESVVVARVHDVSMAGEIITLLNAALEE